MTYYHNMFRIDDEKFGKFTRIKLVNTNSMEHVSVIPDFGANVNEIVLSKKALNYSILDGAKNYSELIKNEWYKGSKLIPFPNRILDGRYTFNRKSFKLPINFQSQKHAIHGLLYNQKFTVKDRTVSKKSSSILLEHLYLGRTDGYPFKFKVHIKYTLSGGGFECNTVIKNEHSAKIPIGDGWHPYFRLKGSLADMLLRIPSTRQIEVDSRNIPTGEIRPFEKFSSLSKIADEEIDSGFQLRKRNGLAETEIVDQEHDLKLTVWQETGEMKYNYVQVFIPPSRKSIAIEPMTCNIDAFNNGEGLIILKPKSTFNATYGVRLE